MKEERGGGAGSRSTRESRLLELAGRITERDREICGLLYEHRVLTTSQVADIGFSTLHKAQERLVVLQRLEVVDRFRPRSWSASAPFHYVLGPAGAAIIAADREMTVVQLGWRRDVGAALASSNRLGHLVGCNGFFTGLIRASRSSRDTALGEWWSERRCAAAWGEVVRPDGYGVWVEAGWRLPFLLEFDLASERLGRLEAKLAGYATLARAAGHPTWVLFTFPAMGRERAARGVLAHPLVPVATAVIPPGLAANGALWLPVGKAERRCRLVELGSPTVTSEVLTSG
jgi:hypothetical protein